MAAYSGILRRLAYAAPAWVHDAPLAPFQGAGSLRHGTGGRPLHPCRPTGYRLATLRVAAPAAGTTPTGLNPKTEVASGKPAARCCSADIPVCGFTGMAGQASASCPVFPCGNWRLESRQNPQAGKPALRSQRNLTYSKKSSVAGLNASFTILKTAVEQPSNKDTKAG